MSYVSDIAHSPVIEDDERHYQQWATDDLDRYLLFIHSYLLQHLLVNLHTVHRRDLLDYLLSFRYTTTRYQPSWRLR